MTSPAAMPISSGSFSSCSMRKRRNTTCSHIDNSKTGRMGPGIRPSLTENRTSFTYHDGDTRLPEGPSPGTKNRSFTVTADVEIPAKGG
jgi:hypothetical protein